MRELREGLGLPLRAVAEATEEAVIDSMLCAETMTGRDGNTAVALPAHELLALMRQYGRM